MLTFGVEMKLQQLKVICANRHQVHSFAFGGRYVHVQRVTIIANLEHAVWVVIEMYRLKETGLFNILRLDINRRLRRAMQGHRKTFAPVLRPRVPGICPVHLMPFPVRVSVPVCRGELSHMRLGEQIHCLLFIGIQ